MRILCYCSGQSHHRCADFPDRVRPRRRDRKIKIGLPHLELQDVRGKYLARIPGTFHQSESRPEKYEQTPCQEEYTGRAQNIFGIQDEFTNLTQSNAEYLEAITNLTDAKITLKYQVALYAN